MSSFFRLANPLIRLLKLPEDPRLLAGAMETLAVRVFGIGLMFALTTLTARYLGPDPAEYGVFATAWTLAILISTLAPLGSDRVLVRNLSTTDDPKECARETALAHWITLAVLCTTPVLYGIAVLLSTVTNSARDSLTVFGLAIILAVPTSLTYLRQWVAIPLLGTRRALTPDQLAVPVLFLGILSILKWSGTPLSATLTACLLACCTLIVWAATVFLSSTRSVYRAALTTSLPRREIVSRIREGLPFVSVAAGGVALQRCMPIVIAMSCGLPEAALFGIALQYAAIPEIPLGACNLCLIPPLARHYKNGELRRADRTVRQLTAVMLLMALGLAAGTWIGSPWLIRLLGTGFTEVHTLLPILFLAAFCHTMTTPAIVVMQTMSLEAIYSRLVLLFVPVHILLVSAGGLFHGLEAACVGYLAARILFTLALVIIARRHRGILCLPLPAGVTTIPTETPAPGNTAARPVL